MVVSNSQGASRRRVLWGSVALLLLASLALACWYQIARTGPPWWTGLPAPTWNGVPAALDAAAQSPLYKEGGVNPARPAVLKDADDKRKVAYAYRVVVDMLRSFTPEQVSAMRKGALPFTRLTVGQQNTLSQLASVLGKEDIRRHSGQSVINISDFAHAGSGTSPVYLFTWAAPGSRGCAYGLWLSFPARQGTAFAGRPVFVQ